MVRKVGQLTSEIAAESDFDPIQVLKDLGIDSNSELFENLREHVEPALGKIQTATGEIVDNAWVNGVDLGLELGKDAIDAQFRELQIIYTSLLNTRKFLTNG